MENKQNAVILKGVVLEMEPFISTSFMQKYVDELCTDEEDEWKYIRNALVTCTYFGYDELFKAFSDQQNYFIAISKRDRMFNHRKHDDYVRAVQVLKNIMNTRGVPDVIIIALDHLV